uniref:glucuronosyltransferase n=1 Tax=Pristionchus pacificus TaxID=54126 RepID=A0A2A6B963_PRIPA|eukprot:PDM62419.1 Glycosyltransferase [Pristionchus pacificus]
MNLRLRTVLISFGTVAEAHTMPEPFKESIKQARPSHNVSRGIPNLIETTWVPQNDMLHDARLSLFITHCGQGSTTEANYAGVPLVVVPVLLDQVRNAYAMKRAGLAVVLEKYKERAVATAKMLMDKPFSGRELFVRNMEFLAAHGPLRMLDHYGQKLTFLQYYLIDIIGFAVLVVSIALAIAAITTIKNVFSARGVLRSKIENK